MSIKKKYVVNFAFFVVAPARSSLLFLPYYPRNPCRDWENRRVARMTPDSRGRALTIQPGKKFLAVPCCLP